MRRSYLGLALIALGTAACPQENLLLNGGNQAFGGGGGTASATLVFTQQPSGATAKNIITPPIQVTVHDSTGKVDTAFTATVNISISLNPTGGNLSGTTAVAPSNGVASFGDLSIDKAGNGYSLRATAAGATGATSNGFNITP